MKKWYVVQTKSTQTEIALENLSAQKIRTFYPLMFEERVRKGLTVNVITPLFKGYVFVQFDINHTAWRRIAGTKGVIQLLTATEDNCISVPKGFVEELIKQADKKGLLALPQVCKIVAQFTKGQTLCITSGIFKGYHGICEKLMQDSAILIMALLNGQHRLTLPLAALALYTPQEVTVR